MTFSTKKGDFGKTEIASGQIQKDSLLIEVIGQMDSCIAEVVLLATKYPFLKDPCQKVIQDCSLICAILTGYQPEESFQHQCLWLEESLDNLSEYQFKFIYPLDNPCAAEINHLRCSVRSAERSCWRLHQKQPVSQNILSYMNRLSDFWYGMCCKELERTDQA